MVLLYDAYVICVVRPCAFGGASCVRGYVRQYTADTHTVSKIKARGVGTVANDYRGWARDRLVLIGTKLGGRSKNSVLRMFLPVF
jgi:hypothetical protein